MLLDWGDGVSLGGVSEVIRKLLLEEIRKRLEPLETTPSDAEYALLTAVTLRGSAGLAGEPNLASALSRLEPRLRAGDAGAVQRTISLLRRALVRLAEGESATAGSWPVPPPDLEPTTIEAYVRAPYEAELKDRLAGIDRCLAAIDEPLEAARIAFRHVHTLKGASSAVGDQPMTWFCHGLEERLREVSDVPSARAALVELGQYRGVLGGLTEDPLATLRRLRGGTIRLASGSGQGFTVSIDVPLDPTVSAPRPRLAPLNEADLGDAAAIMIENSSAPDTRDPGTRRAAAMTRINEELGRPWARVRAARIGDELVGFLVTWQVVDEVHVLDIATKVTARRRGVGRALMDELIALTRTQPVKHLLLEVRRSNVAAIWLYKSLGFYATNVRKRYYDDGEDAVEMRLVFHDDTREVVPTPDEFPLDPPSTERPR